VMIALTVALLGGFDVRLSSGTALSLPTKKSQALLAYLGLRPGQTHQRDKLAALLWGEHRDEQARDGLRHGLAALRKALPDATPPALLVEGQTLAVNPAVVEVDAAIFERSVAKGTPEALQQAARIYRGELLLGFTLNEPLFEEWLVAERERLREIALEALARLLAHQTKSRGTERVIQTAVRLLGLDPLQEAVRRTLMRLYARQGRRGAALKQYHVCVTVLQRELGAEPEEATKQLYQDILRRGPLGKLTSPDPTPPESPHVGEGRVDLPIADTPLIGRVPELARLHEALDQAGKAHGKLIVLVGEAGIGKTTVSCAVAAVAAARGARVLLGRCYESASILPFGPWVDAFRSGQILEDETRLSALGPVWRSELARLLPELARPGLPTPSDNPLRLFESVAHLIEQLAARQLLVLVLDDVHWADDMSLRLLAFVARRTHRWRALLLTTAREEELAEASAARRTLAEVGREAHATTLKLAPLSRPDTVLLVRSLSRVGRDAEALAHLEEEVWRVSEGNPFIVVETIRAIQAGTIIASPSSLPVAERVRELIVGCLEGLSKRARELASVAAVIGRPWDISLLRRAARCDEVVASRAVEELVRRRVLEGVGERFDFAHERIHAVVYNQLLPPEQKLFHRRVGEAIEELHGANLEPHVLALGIHYLRAEVWDNALGYLRQAGTQAAARSANREAVTCFDQALAVLSHLPAPHARLELATDLHLELCNPFQASGELERAAACSREAERLAQQLDDSQRLARASIYMCHHYRRVGQMTQASIVGQHALAIADQLNDRPLMISAAFSLGLVRSYLGEYRGAEELLRSAMVAVDDQRIHDLSDLDGLPAVIVPGHLARMLAECGRFEEGITLGQRARDSAEALQHPATLVTACWALGWLHNVRGGLHQAVPLLERGHALSRKWELSGWIPNVLEQLGVAYAYSGREDPGFRMLEESSDGYAALGRHPLTVYPGEAYLLTGRPHDAAAFAEKTLALAERLGQPRLQALALHLSGECDSQNDRIARNTAERRHRQALALAEQLGMRPLVAHCHLGLSKLPPHGQARAGSGAPHHRDDDVPRDGHAVLAGAGGAEGVGLNRAQLRVMPEAGRNWHPAPGLTGEL
jgi:DNA-binding SARP family transcriptional activator